MDEPPRVLHGRRCAGYEAELREISGELVEVHAEPILLDLLGERRKTGLDMLRGVREKEP